MEDGSVGIHDIARGKQTPQQEGSAGMPRSIDRLYSEGVMEKRFLNAALKVRIVRILW